MEEALLTSEIVEKSLYPSSVRFSRTVAGPRKKPLGQRDFSGQANCPGTWYRKSANFGVVCGWYCSAVIVAENRGHSCALTKRIFRRRARLQAEIIDGDV